MKDGFVKVFAATPEIKVADCNHNAQAVISLINAAEEKKSMLTVFPELTLTGATAGDLFFSDTLIEGAENALATVLKATSSSDALTLVGLPVKKDGALYSCAAAMQNGKLMAVVPRETIVGQAARHFTSAPEENATITLCAQTVPFGNKIIFRAQNMPELTVAAELSSDLFAPIPPSTIHAMSGANIIACLSAENELIGKRERLETALRSHTSRNKCGYVYADAGRGESTTDQVFGGEKTVVENGKVLSYARSFTNNLLEGEIDVSFIACERVKCGYPQSAPCGYEVIDFTVPEREVTLTRTYPRLPFVPEQKTALDERAEYVLELQAEGLAKRIAHAGAKSVVIGISGGLDSCLALLVAVRALKKLNRPTKDVTAISMPALGTTKRTKSNAQRLSELLGTNFKTINITSAVMRHFKDIKHDPAVTDATFENAQARERTQVLMDVANSLGGIVVGTGDLSEAALGWATYNGDHMSMYGVNCDIPKTVVRKLVAYEAEHTANKKVQAVLCDILDTPVSPELLPAKEGEIAQKTEEIVGNYELHDFFIYHFVRCGFSAGKIYRLAKYAFDGEHDGETVAKWLRVFIRRFFTQQFKRSCVPDGVQVGSVALSPRGAWQMPSDAVSALWLADLDARIDKDNH